MADAARPLPGLPVPSDEEILREVNDVLDRMVIALARKAAYEDHIAARAPKSSS